MSNIYNLEPPTKGKVILKTNLGDLEIELWAKEAPKACRNFVQLCMEGYYDGTVFHRVIKDYIAQGGDPTGTGNGGESIYGQPFKDEFHQRLKFTRRGLVACANANEPHTNGSQFFVTLDKADWLNNRNTIFGRVVGDTVYNLLRFNDLAVDDNDRPLDPPVIRDAEVVWNPFEDLVPRVDKEAIKAEQEAKAMAAAARKRAAGRTKNLALLSFGDEAEEEEAQMAAAAGGGRGGRGGGAGGGAKIRSAHDVLEDERLAREAAVEAAELERLAAERPAKRPRGGRDGGQGEGGEADAFAKAKAAVQQAAGRAARGEASRWGDDPGAGAGAEDGGGEEGKAASRAFADSMRARAMAAREKAGDLPPPPKAPRDKEASGSSPPREREGERGRGRDGGGSGEDDDDAEERRGGGGCGAGQRDFLAERRAEMDAMRAEATNRTYGRMKTTTEVADADLLKPWQLSRERYKARKKAVGDREKDTLARLNKFQAALRGGPSTQAPADKDTGKDKKDQDTEQDGGGGAQEDEGAAGEGKGTGKGGGGGGYAGKVRSDLDHRAYMPAAWRVDEYLDGEGEGEGEQDDLASLRQHRFEAAKDKKDAMSRDMDNLDDYVVFDPLLEKGKGKWSAAAQKEAKRNNEWAGRANM